MKSGEQMKAPRAEILATVKAAIAQQRTVAPIVEK